jgi:hypothetical protein
MVPHGTTNQGTASALPQIALTDATIRSIPIPSGNQIEYFDTSFKGGSFSVRVTRRGSKSFVLWHRGRRKTLGRFPNISLRDARAAASRILAEFTLRKLQPKAITYDEAVRIFLEAKAHKRQQTLYNYKYFLGRIHLNGHLDQISYHDIRDALSRIKTDSVREHIAVVLRALFTWAHKNRIISGQPLFWPVAEEIPTQITRAE